MSGGTEDIGRIALLDEPTRLALYGYVRGRGVAVGRDEAAGALGISRALAAFHLDRLAKAGILDVEYRRLSGRTGRGAGRPAKLYRTGRVRMNVNLPETRYELAGSVLLRSIETRAAGEDGRVSVERSAIERGSEVGRELRRSVGRGSSMRRAERALEELGFEPVRAGGVIRMRNCPFHSIVEENVDLVCSLNRALVAGLLDGLGCEGVSAEEEPEPAACCVRLRRTRPVPSPV